MQDRDATFVRVIVTASFVCSIVIALVALVVRVSGGQFLVGLQWAVAILALTLSAAFFFFVVPYLHRHAKPVNWLMIIAVLNVFVIVPELALRTGEFRYEPGIQFGFPRPRNFLRFEVDPKLFWKLPSSRSDVNSLGFIGDEIPVPKPAGTYRMLFLGDSVTQQGYPEIVERALNTRMSHGSTSFESVNLAMAGYSSHQGRVLAERYGSTFQPDLVVVYYGWNDHWQAYGAIDSEKQVKPSKIPWAKINTVISLEFRVAQGINRIWESFSVPRLSGGELRVRVPLDEYGANLAYIKGVFEAENVPVVFITAPTSYYGLGVTNYLVLKNFVRDKPSAIKLHREYNEVVRAIPQTASVHILDLEEEYSAYEDETLRAIFLEDGMHLRDQGLQIMGDQIADFINERIISVD